MKWLKFLKALFVLILAAALQLVIGELTSIWLNFILAALVGLAFFLSFAELVFFVLLGVFILNWQPALSWEMVTLAALPLFVFWFRRILPWQVWLSAVVATAVSFLIFYAVISAGFVFRAPFLFLFDFLAGLGFSSAAVWAMGGHRYS